MITKLLKWLMCKQRKLDLKTGKTLLTLYSKMLKIKPTNKRNKKKEIKNLPSTPPSRCFCQCVWWEMTWFVIYIKGFCVTNINNTNNTMCCKYINNTSLNLEAKPVGICCVTKEPFGVLPSHISKVPRFSFIFLLRLAVDEVMFRGKSFLPPTFHFPPLWIFLKQLQK